MNELFDKLIIRIFFTLFICFIIFLYKYIYSFVYPSSKQQLFRTFYPSKNPANTLILFSRFIGIGIVFSEFTFHMHRNFFMILTTFFSQAIITSLLYLVSLYVIESIVLYNFEYTDEILKRKNMPYALIQFAHSLSLGYIMKIILKISNESLVILLFIWLFAMILIGLSTKTFSYYSKLPFNRLLVQKDISIAPSYMGFILGWTIIISSVINHSPEEIQWYGIQVILKALLALIIIPLFLKGFKLLFKISKEEEKTEKITKNNEITAITQREHHLGPGVFEGSVFFTSCFLTTVIIDNIDFGSFYPL